ncbi:MAG: 4Fe-4S dicluster domain-containing protein [Syntrophomonas sp.]
MAKKRWGMVIDLNKCVGCHACSVACLAENKVADGKYRTRIIENDEGVFPKLAHYTEKWACNHCQDAPCVKACPTKASHYTEWGTVDVDPDLCIGCGYCVLACPYRVRMMDESRYGGLPVKCSLCTHRLEEGKKPACESTCIASAIITGDLNNANSEINKWIQKGAVVRHPEYNTKPNVYVIPFRR